FFNNTGAISLGEGAELWFGYHQSIRPMQTQLTFNIDMAATAFVEAMPALDYLVETCRLQDVPASLNKTQVVDANKSFRGVKITVTHRGTVDRQYRVNGLKRSAKETMMEGERGGRMNIADYAQNYRPLRYPNLAAPRGLAF
ncbi:hypothetical protein As57867_022215, partial [Aphanomyces stellatus]